MCNTQFYMQVLGTTKEPVDFSQPGHGKSFSYQCQKTKFKKRNLNGVKPLKCFSHFTQTHMEKKSRHKCSTVHGFHWAPPE